MQRAVVRTFGRQVRCLANKAKRRNLTSKMANKNFYKGRGAPASKLGHWTRNGHFVLDKEKVEKWTNFNIPEDLDESPMKAYVDPRLEAPYTIDAFGKVEQKPEEDRDHGLPNLAHILKEMHVEKQELIAILDKRTMPLQRVREAVKLLRQQRTLEEAAAEAYQETHVRPLVNPIALQTAFDSLDEKWHLVYDDDEHITDADAKEMIAFREANPDCTREEFFAHFGIESKGVLSDVLDDKSFFDVRAPLRPSSQHYTRALRDEDPAFAQTADSETE
ncbi:MAG: hypothetical protein MHM6MM_002680 [Cercozoa sp. M6MM]